eukprot:PhM_4_TR3482/c0_g1_i1/m.14747
MMTTQKIRHSHLLLLFILLLYVLLLLCPIFVIATSSTTTPATTSSSFCKSSFVAFKGHESWPLLQTYYAGTRYLVAGSGNRLYRLNDTTAFLAHTQALSEIVHSPTKFTLSDNFTQVGINSPPTTTTSSFFDVLLGNTLFRIHTTNMTVSVASSSSSSSSSNPFPSDLAQTCSGRILNVSVFAPERLAWLSPCNVLVKLEEYGVFPTSALGGGEGEGCGDTRLKLWSPRCFAPGTVTSASAAIGVWNYSSRLPLPLLTYDSWSNSNSKEDDDDVWCLEDWYRNISVIDATAAGAAAATAAEQNKNNNNNNNNNSVLPTPTPSSALPSSSPQRNQMNNKTTTTTTAAPSIDDDDDDDDDKTSRGTGNGEEEDHGLKERKMHATVIVSLTIAMMGSLVVGGVCALVFLLRRFNPAYQRQRFMLVGTPKPTPTPTPMVLLDDKEREELALARQTLQMQIQRLAEELGQPPPPSVTTDTTTTQPDINNNNNNNNELDEHHQHQHQDERKLFAGC